jgi:hypothetical protein
MPSSWFDDPIVQLVCARREGKTLQEIRQNPPLRKAKARS